MTIHACAGVEPYPVDTLDLCIRAAAGNIQDDPNRERSIDTAEKFFALLDFNKTALADRIAQSFKQEFDAAHLIYSDKHLQRSYTTETLLLALALDLPQAVYQGLSLVCQIATCCACFDLSSSRICPSRMSPSCMSQAAMTCVIQAHHVCGYNCSQCMCTAL